MAAPPTGIRSSVNIAGFGPPIKDPSSSSKRYSYLKPKKPRIQLNEINYQQVKKFENDGIAIIGENMVGCRVCQVEIDCTHKDRFDAYRIKCHVNGKRHQELMNPGSTAKQPPRASDGFFFPKRGKGGHREGLAKNNAVREYAGEGIVLNEDDTIECKYCSQIIKCVHNNKFDRNKIRSHCSGRRHQMRRANPELYLNQPKRKKKKKKSKKEREEKKLKAAQDGSGSQVDFDMLYSRIMRRLGADGEPLVSKNWVIDLIDELHQKHRETVGKLQQTTIILAKAIGEMSRNRIQNSTGVTISTPAPPVSRKTKLRRLQLNKDIGKALSNVRLTSKLGTGLHKKTTDYRKMINKAIAIDRKRSIRETMENVNDNDEQDSSADTQEQGDAPEPNALEPHVELVVGEGNSNSNADQNDSFQAGTMQSGGDQSMELFDNSRNSSDDDQMPLFPTGDILQPHLFEDFGENNEIPAWLKPKCGRSPQGLDAYKVHKIIELASKDHLLSDRTLAEKFAITRHQVKRILAKAGVKRPTANERQDLLLALTGKKVKPISSPEQAELFCNLALRTNPKKLLKYANKYLGFASDARPNPMFLVSQRNAFGTADPSSSSAPPRQNQSQSSLDGSEGHTPAQNNRETDKMDQSEHRSTAIPSNNPSSNSSPLHQHNTQSPTLQNNQVHENGAQNSHLISQSQHNQERIDNEEDISDEEDEPEEEEVEAMNLTEGGDRSHDRRMSESAMNQSLPMSTNQGLNHQRLASCHLTESSRSQLHSADILAQAAQMVKQEPQEIDTHRYANAASPYGLMSHINSSPHMPHMMACSQSDPMRVHYNQSPNAATSHVQNTMNQFAADAAAAARYWPPPHHQTPAPSGMAPPASPYTGYGHPSPASSPVIISHHHPSLPQNYR